jgi:propionate CoA-transferase
MSRPRKASRPSRLTNEQGNIGGAPASRQGGGRGDELRRAWSTSPTSSTSTTAAGSTSPSSPSPRSTRRATSTSAASANKLIGPGGFINISQNAKKVVFSGAFRAGGLDVAIGDGRLEIRAEGRHAKLVEAVEQVTYSGVFGRSRGQQVLFVTERAVFAATGDGLELIELAPGVDLERDVLAGMSFRPRISPDLKTMDARLFLEQPMGLRADLAAKPGPVRSIRLAELDDPQPVVAAVTMEAEA